MKKLLLLFIGVMMTFSARAAIGDDAFTIKTTEGWTMVFQIISEEEKTCMVGARYLVIDGIIRENVPGVLKYNPESWNEKTSSYDEQFIIDKVVIPAEANGYKVTQIRDLAFYNYQDLMEIELPEGLEVIGSMAFANCKVLKSIDFPSTLKEIGGMSFQECDAMETVILPEGLTAVYASAFKAAGVYLLSLPSTLTTLGSEAFSYNPLSQVYARLQTPIDIPADAFTQLDPITHKPAQKSSALFVTPGLADSFKAVDCWNDTFRYIWDHMSYDEWLATDVKEVKEDASAEVEYYDMNGRKVQSAQRGVYVVRDKEGNIKKRFVR